MNSLGFNLAKRLKSFRQTYDETQEWLAHKLGVSRGTINRWEALGAGRITLDELEGISKKTEIKVQDLLGLTTELSKDQWTALTSNFQTLTLNPNSKIIPQDIQDDLISLDPRIQETAWLAIRAVISGLKSVKNNKENTG
jgi:transcriptional regulator with XRE-family HTH domain